MYGSVGYAYFTILHLQLFSITLEALDIGQCKMSLAFLSEAAVPHLLLASLYE